jgi:hypothetical protein
MSYIGSTPTTQSFISGTDYFNGDGTTTAFTLSRKVASINDIEVLVNNVPQQPNVVYIISGTTLTFTSAPSSGTQNIYVRYLSTVTQNITTGQGTVNSAQLGLITTIPTTGGNTITLPASTGTVALTSQITSSAAPQVTALTSGSGTYTVPAGARYLLVEMVGGGGGGAGGGNNATGGNGGTGGTTIFGTSLLSCSGGGSTMTSSSGGVGTITLPAYGIAASGSCGGGFTALNGSGVYLTGGTGAASVFGGNGYGSANAPGNAALANTGSGGGGGGNNASNPAFGACGGGSGGYIKAYIPTPSSTYSYTIGSGGAGGTAGTNGFAGAAGGSGIIYVTTYFG